MRRKNTPGCYCCTEPCECIDGLPPELTISGYTGNGWVRRFDCCFSQEFTPDEPVVSRYCSDVISRWVISQNCQRTYYTLDVTGRLCPTITRDPTYNCGDLAANCCGDESWVQVGSTDGTQTFTTEIHHIAYHELALLRVFLLRRIVMCSEEPVCKWMLILEYHVNYQSTIVRRSQYDYAQTVISDSACFEVDPVYDGECSYEINPLDCEAYNSSNCGTSGNLCIHRIKFFDFFPSGNHTFSNSDIPASCNEPDFLCSSCVWDFSTIVCIEPEFYCPPSWCTDPPTVVTTATTFEFDYACGFFTYYPDEACDNDCPFGCVETYLTACFEPQNCTVPSLVVDCDSVEWPSENPEYEPPECDGCGRGSDGNPFSPVNIPLCSPPIRMLCTCQNSPFPFIQVQCTATCDEPCGDCCYTCFECSGCPNCAPKYTNFFGGGSVYPGDATTSFTITCDELITEPDYCITFPSITMTLDELS